MSAEHFNTLLGNGISLGAIIGTLAGWLPPIAALIAAVWYCVQIYESKSFQGFLMRRRAKRAERLEKQLAKLQAKLPVKDDTY